MFPHPKDEESDENKEYNTTSDRENLGELWQTHAPMFPLNHSPTPETSPTISVLPCRRRA